MKSLFTHRGDGRVVLFLNPLPYKINVQLVKKNKKKFGTTVFFYVFERSVLFHYSGLHCYMILSEINLTCLFGA